MGDMLQIVRWALETTCALRSAEWSTDPGRSLGEVAMAKAVGAPPNELEEHFGVFGDVYVSSCRYLSIPEESHAQVPEEPSSLLACSGPGRGKKTDGHTSTSRTAVF